MKIIQLELFYAKIKNNLFKKQSIVEMTLAEDNNQIFASKYQTVLPSKEELQHLLNEE